MGRWLVATFQRRDLPDKRDATQPARVTRDTAILGEFLGDRAPRNKKESQPNWLAPFKLPLLGSNQDSPDPEPGV